MIFELRTSPIDGRLYAVTPDEMYASENEDTEPFELQRMLASCYPNQRFSVSCFGAYENAVNLN
jgi:hypothetical protein